MKQPITGFHIDEEDTTPGHNWVAELGCGHQQHVRHNPPWQNRMWVISEAGRKKMLGHQLDCKLCD